MSKVQFNVWPIYVGGLVVGTLPMFATAQDGIAFFFSALPFNFYAIFAILLTFLFAWEKLPFIPGRKMRDAIVRTREPPANSITRRPCRWQRKN